MVNIVFIHNTHKLLEIKSKKSCDKVKYLYRQICFLFCLPLLRVIKHAYFCFRFRNAFWYNESRPLRWPNWLKWSLHYLLTTFFFLFAYDLKKKKNFLKGFSIHRYGRDGCHFSIIAAFWSSPNDSSIQNNLVGFKNK